MSINLVETMDEVLQVALERLPVPQAQVSEAISDLKGNRPSESIAH
jgi:hypothetical protein